MSNIRATKNRVILKQAATEKTSSGGLILSTNMEAERDRGVVVDVGPNVEGITVGDTVILSHLGVTVGPELVSVHYDHIIAVLHE